MDYEDFEMTEAMLCYGGSFVSLLARTYRAADETNREKLRAAFRECFERYTELAKFRRQQQERV